MQADDSLFKPIEPWAPLSGLSTMMKVLRNKYKGIGITISIKVYLFSFYNEYTFKIYLFSSSKHNLINLGIKV